MSQKINATISAGFSLKDVMSDEFYLRLEQITEEDTADLGEVADLVDSLFDIDPCNPNDEKEEEEEEEKEAPEDDDAPLVDYEHLSDMVKRHFGLDYCDYNAMGDWRARVKVIISTIGADYVIRLTNGKVVDTVVTSEEINDYILITDNATDEEREDDNKTIASSGYGFTLPYPVKSNFSVKWNGSPTTDLGKISPPTITLTGNTLNWGVKVKSGSLTVGYVTQYDVIEIIIPGANQLENLLGLAEIEFGECTVRGFSSYYVDEQDLSPPKLDGDDADRDNYCGEGSGTHIDWPDKRKQWVTTKTDWKCVCSGDHAYYTYSKEPTKAQRESGDWIFPGVTKEVFGDYVGCEEAPSYLHERDYYIDNCCVPPKFALPWCKYWHRKNKQYTEISDDHKKRLKDMTDRGIPVRLFPVTPEDGDCGITTYRQEVTSQNCCEDVDPMEWDPEFSPTVVPGLYHFFYGKGPWTVRVTGEGFYLDKNDETVKVIEIYVPWFRVYLTDEACGGGNLRVTDACDQELTKKIRAPDGQWSKMTDPSSDRSQCANILHTPICCSGRWAPCVIADPPYAGRGQCENYYSGGISYIQVYQPTAETTDGEYKIVRNGCSGHRSCYGPCWEDGNCTLTDAETGLTYEVLLTDPCYPDYADKITNSRYRWVC